MDLRGIIDVCKEREIYEERYVSDEYFEVVFFHKDVELWTSCLAQFLDSPAKPAGKLPSKEQMELTSHFGGIRKNQVLFVKESAESKIIAMFWPWNDDVHVTLRMAVVHV